MTLRDLPKSMFPFRFEKYSRIYEDLDAAADRFAALGYPDLAKEMEATRNRLSQAWDSIRAAESDGR